MTTRPSPLVVRVDAVVKVDAKRLITALRRRGRALHRQAQSEPDAHRSAKLFWRGMGLGDAIDIVQRVASTPKRPGTGGGRKK